MKMYLQIGAKMMGLSRELFELWGGGTAILSPRDLEPKQIEKFGQELTQLKGDVLVDPQFYLPRADHHRLTSYDYWPKDYDTQGFSDENRESMLQKLISLNSQAKASRIIVPGERGDIVDDLWLGSQEALLRAARSVTDLPLIATICLSSEAIRSSEQINLVIEQAEKLKIDGYYLILEHPGYDYFVIDPVWLANALDLTAGLFRLGAQIIVGYSNQQQLIMSCAGVYAIASGTWMNVRSFFPDKFRENYEKEVKRRTTWYYCPQALSEYTLPYLDIGFRLGLRNEFIPIPRSKYADLIIESPMPSASGWSESLAFRQYLDTLHLQVDMATKDSFETTINYQRELLDQASDLLTLFTSNDIRGQTRDYSSAVDASRAALRVLEKTHGPLLKRSWNDFNKVK